VANAPTVDPGPQQLFIGGRFVPGGNGGYEVRNPATEAVVGEAPDASVDDAEAAVDAARSAFPGWSQTDPAERARLLDALADAVAARHDELAPLIQAETGATWKVSNGLQLTQVVERFRRYARGAMETTVLPLPPQLIETTDLAPGGVISAFAARRPVGVVLAITSYNFPLTNMAGKLGPALAAGNPVIVKPAPQDPLAILKFAEIAQDVGFPDGVINVVVGEGVEVAEALVASPGIDMVSFTGSTAVGRRIGSVAGEGMTRLLLELGGKGASIIFDDADVPKAIMGTGSTWAFHSGQICTAPTRVLAQRGVYDQVVAGLAQFAGALKVGDPLEDDTVVGPVISEAHRSRIEDHIASGVTEGAEVVAGGSRPSDLETGWYVPPTLLAGCTADMRAVREEIFGPVIVVVPFDDDDEAEALANGTDYGLYDYIWSGDVTRAVGLAGRLRTGNVGINTLQRNHEAPFGGFKLSGVGRDGGSFGLHAYSELQSVVWPDA
jgi:acyl-CoA reductase-like NAD-dependent aldehyde dehydrogenase